MQKKISELWPGFMRLLPGRNSQANNSGQQPEEDQDSDESSSSSEVDEQQLLTDYDKLYWTRLMAIEVFAPGFDRKHALRPMPVRVVIWVILSY